MVDEQPDPKTITHQSKIAFPMVSFAAVPLYPPLARVSNVAGIVHVKIRTDGHKVTEAKAEKNSNSLLASAAEANALTWQFTIHEPMRFTVTYRYKLVNDIEPVQNNPRVILRLPTEVEVDALRSAGTIDMPPVLKPHRPAKQ